MSENKKLSETEKKLQKKQYDKPKAVTFYDSKDPSLYGHSDLVLQDGFMTFVLPENKDSHTPEPTHYWFAVADARPFFKGARILVDTVDGRSAMRVVKEVDRNVIILKDKLTHLPKVGGDVFRVLGNKTTLIDTKNSGWT